MADVDNVVIEVELDGKKGFVALRKDVESAGKDAGKSLEDAIADGVNRANNKITERLIKIGASIAAALFSKRSIEAALESENAVENFNKALLRTGQFSTAATEDFQKFAADIQKTFKVSDEAVLQAATSIQNIGRLTEPELKRATTAALNLSKALSIDLQSATHLVAKATEGNIGALARQGIKIKQGADEAETYANFLKVIETRFNDAGKSLGNNFNSKLKELGLNFGDIFESFGKLITGSRTAVAFVGLISKAFGAVGTSLDKLGTSGDIIKIAIESLAPFAQGVNKFIVAPIELAYNLVKTGLLFITGALVFAVQGLIELSAPLVNIANKIGLVSDTTKEQFDIIRQTVNKTYDDINEKTQKSVDETFDFKLAAAVNKGIGHVQKFADTAPAITKAGTDGVQAAIDDIDFFALDVGFGLLTLEFEDLAQTADEQTINIADSIKTHLKGAISSSLAAVGAALVKGENAFQAFGGAVMKAIGAFAVDVGTTMVLMGLGVNALKAALLTFQGAAAIAIGAALIVLGGALQAASAGPAASSGGGASQAASPAGVASEPAAIDQGQVNQNKGTSVTINVEGNILDRRETGLALVETIQSYFDTNSGVVVQS